MADRDDQRTERVLRHPEKWATGDESWTTAQRSYLHTLAREAGAELPEEMTKADASKLIDDLQAQTGRSSANQ